MAASDWRLEGARKDLQSITSDWDLTGQHLIEGVQLREVRNVPKRDGRLVEVYRRDWGLDGGEVDQVFEVTLFSGGVNAWHAHERTTDRLFVTEGLVLIVLFDARPGSSTDGVVNEFRLGEVRPGLVVVPPKVWHGVRNIGPDSARILNLTDRAYEYLDPDHWRVPPDSPTIPYRFWEPARSHR